MASSPMLQRVMSWDVRVSLALQARRSPVLNFVAQALSWSGAGGAWFGTAGVLMIAGHLGRELVPRQLEFLAAMAGAFATLLVGGLIKSATGRRRPFASEVGVQAAIWAPGKARSFPSTHAATSVALATHLLLIGHPFAPWLTAWAVGVSLSRVWLGVHFATDVLAGVVLGVVFGLIPWGPVLAPLAFLAGG
ncbi:MAG: phosphatase PAP2 family protein [Myxococcaceae bacterium]